MDERIAAVIVTLNKIETHGKENLTRLLGCIKTLEEIRAEGMNAEEQNDSAE